VAKKEHQEFASNIDFIDCLPPGLYEAVLTPVGETADPGGLVVGDYVVSFHARTLEDIRALGCNDLEDERKFAAAARLSEVNLGLYRTFLQPWARAMATAQSAELLRELNPSRLQFALFSDRNPFMAPVAALAEWVRTNRRPVGAANPFLALQEQASRQIEASLDGWRDWRDGLMEASFHAVYGSALLQALLGLRASEAPPRVRPGREPEELAFVRERIEELRAVTAKGGLRAAFVRAMIYVRLPELNADERSFAELRKVRAEHASDLSLADFKALVRDQFLMIMLDEETAVAAIPQLLAGHEAEAPRAFDLLKGVVTAAGPLGEAAAARLERVAGLFGAAAGSSSAAKPPAGAPRRLSVAGGTDG
jgi:hypothetical protein